MLVTRYFSRVGSNFYSRLYFSGLSQWISKKLNMFDISPTLHDSVSRLWLRQPGNCLVNYLRLVWLHTQFCSVLLPYCLEKLTVLSWFSTRTPPPDRPATLTDCMSRREVCQSSTVESVTSQRDKLRTQTDKAVTQQTSRGLCMTDRLHFYDPCNLCLYKASCFHNA